MINAENWVWAKRYPLSSWNTRLYVFDETNGIVMLFRYVPKKAGFSFMSMAWRVRSWLGKVIDGTLRGGCD